MIQPALPELLDDRKPGVRPLESEYSSRDNLLDLDGIRELLTRHRLHIEQTDSEVHEVVR